MALVLALVVGSVTLAAAPAAAGDVPVAPCIFIDGRLHCGKTHAILNPPCPHCPWVMPYDVVLPPDLTDVLGAELIAGLDAVPDQGAMVHFDRAVSVLGNNSLVAGDVGFVDLRSGAFVPYQNPALASRARHLAAGIALLQRGLRPQAWTEFLIAVDDGTPLPA